MEDASLQLISVKKTQTNDAYEQSVTYEVLVKDSQSDFFTELGAKELTDLDFSDLNHTYDSSTIVASWSNTVADGFKYLLPYSGDNFYPLKEMKPAIYAKTYFDRIFSNAGFSHDWSTLQDAYFDKLLIPYNGEIESFDFSAYLVTATNSVTIDGYQTQIGQNIGFYEQLTGWTETQDTFNLFTPLTGIYTNQFTVTSGDSINFNFACQYDINLINPIASTANLLQIYGGTSTMEYRYSLVIAVANLTQNQFYNSGANPYDAFVVSGTNIPSGTTNLGTFTKSINVAISNCNIGDVIQIQAGLAIQAYSPTNSNGVLRWVDTLSNFVAVDVQLDLTSISMSVLPSSTINGFGGTLQVNNYVPKKIKQSDFVKSIFTMYNLYTEIDPDNPNKLTLCIVTGKQIGRAHV